MGARALFSILLAITVATPAAAQFSDSYNFLKAVRDADGDKTTQLIDKPGLINTKDPGTGETALHIVVRRHDETWLNFLLAKGAEPNARDRQGETPLIVAARQSDPDAVRLLLQGGAGANVANNAGETPLIIAVQRRDAASARLLIAGGADPRIADHVAGKSARDYAAADQRSAAILRILDEAKPKALPRNVAGPVKP